MRIALLTIVVGLLFQSAPAYAQSKSILKRASRGLQSNAKAEETREAFELISNALREEPNLATPMGWWIRGDAAAIMAVTNERPATLVAVALDSYHEALKRGMTSPDVSRLAQIEERMTGIASDPDQSDTDRYEAITQLLTSLELRKRSKEAGGPRADALTEARIRTLSVEVALETNNLPAARRLFFQLESLGGLNQPLAMRLAEVLEDSNGPLAAFTFLHKLLERHANRRDLLLRYTTLCLENGWNDETRQGLDLALPYMKDTYEDHKLLADHFERLHDPSAALQYYRRARAKVPKSYEANYGVARTLVATLPPTPLSLEDEPDRSEEPAMDAAWRAALQAALVATEQNPKHRPLLSMTAKIHEKLGNEDALTAIRALLEGLEPAAENSEP